MNLHNIDKYLSDNSMKPDIVVMHPKIWNGYWSVKNHNKVLRNVFRWLGRKFHNKHLYWVGLPVYWEQGLKDYIHGK